MQQLTHRLASGKDLQDAYKTYKPLLALRQGGAPSADDKVEFLVCGDTGCRSINSLHILDSLTQAIQASDLGHRASAHITGCFGFCKKGPIVKVFPDDVYYVEVNAEDAGEIVAAHLVHNTPVERLLYKNPDNPDVCVPKQDDMDFYKKQTRRVLANCGLIQPDRIEEYIAAEGYQGLAKCLDGMSPKDVRECIKKSGLRGRGGGGFPAGVKWDAAAAQRANVKYMVCNADEGDPGAFMDRSILEGDPHSVIEGMIIAAYAIGASQGYVYIRAEYPLAIKRLQLAVAQAKDAGLLGQNILGSGFSFDLDLRYGAGAFVCGEETALLHSIEGKRGEPTPKPPFPAEKGLYGQPTVINNVETLANVPRILRNGPQWLNAVGTAKSKGTKVFALAGKVNNVGLVEVPMGITLREIIFEIGGGIADGKKCKAVQTGGPSGGCIDMEHIDIPIDYESLGSVGSMMGSGGMIVIDEHNCMVDIAKYYLEFTMDESCGKCTPCRVGTKRMHELLTDITEGRGTEAHLEKLENLGKVVRDTALCGLGQTAPNPVLSTLRFFRDEYLAHIRDKHCPAKVCNALLEYVVTEDCIGCELCVRTCPVACITGESRQIHHIDASKCIKCSACIRACPAHAIIRI